MNKLELLIKISEVRELLEGAVASKNVSRMDDLLRCLLQLYHSLYLLEVETESNKKGA